MNSIIEDFLTKVEDSKKFVVLGATIQDFLADKAEYIILRPLKSDEFQIEIKRQQGDTEYEYLVNPVIITDDEDEFKMNLVVKNKKQFDTLIHLTANSLRQYRSYKRYAKLLEDML